MSQETSLIEHFKSLCRECKGSSETLYDKLEAKFSVDEIAEILSGWVSDEDTEIVVQQCVLLPIRMGLLYRKGKYLDVVETLQDVNLADLTTNNDYLNSLLIKLQYFANKKLNTVDIDYLYALRASNNELSNYHSTAVITVCILDYNFDNDIYLHMNLSPAVYSPEILAFYNFLCGKVNLVRNRLKCALDNFEEADVLNKNPRLAVSIYRLIVVTKLLLADYEFPLLYHNSLVPYYRIATAVKRGSPASLKSLIEQYRDELFSHKLYYIIKRLLSNTLIEGIRRISECYRRIKIDDVCCMLGINASYLISKCINDRVILATIQDDVLITKPQVDPSPPSTDLSMLARTIRIRKEISAKIKYPEVSDLTYELVEQRNKELEENFS